MHCAERNSDTDETCKRVTKERFLRDGRVDENKCLKLPLIGMLKLGEREVMVAVKRAILAEN